MKGLNVEMNSMVTPSYAVKAAPTVFLQHIVLDRSLLAGHMLHNFYPDLRIVFRLMTPPDTLLAPPLNSSIQSTIICKKTQLTYVWNSQQLTFPISISNLPQAAHFHIRIYIHDILLGYTDFPLYNEHFALRCMMHTCLLKPVAYTDDQISGQLPPIELSFELALPHSEDRTRTIANTVCYAPEGLFRKTSMGSITTTADAHLVLAKSPAHVSLLEMNALLSPSITTDMDLTLAHKVIEHYYRVAMKEALYLNKPHIQKQLTASLFNQEAVAVSNYAAITVQNYIPYMQFYDCEQVLAKFATNQEAGVFSRLAVALKTATEKPLSDVDLFGLKNPTSTYTNAETLSHLRNIIAHSFNKYQTNHTPTSSQSTDAFTTQDSYCTLTHTVLAATSIDEIKLDQFNPTDYALALNYKISSKCKVRDQNEHILSAIAPQYDADPSTLVPDNASAGRLAKLCDVLFTHQLRSQDKDLIWKYRYYMRKYPRGLIKVISSIPQSYRNVLIKQHPVKVKSQDSGQTIDDSVDETVNQDLRHIVGELKTLLYTWNDPAIDQILLLLSREYSLYNLNTNVIREYAINKLNQFADSVLLQFLLELTFKIDLDESLCIVDIFNYKELYQSIEEQITDQQEAIAREKKERLETAEQDLLNITPIIETRSISSKGTKKKNELQSKSILSGMIASPAEFFDLRGAKDQIMDSKTSITSIPAISNTFNSSSKLSIKSFTHHSFSVEIQAQNYGRNQVMPKSTLQKATIANEEEASPFCEAKFDNITDLQFDTMDMSYTDSSEGAPTILLRGTDDHTTSDDTKGTIGEHSQTSGKEEPAPVLNSTEPQRYLTFKNLSDMLIARAISAPYTFYLFYFYVDLWYSNSIRQQDENAQRKLLACRDGYYAIMKEKDPEFYSCLRSTILFSQQLINISKKSLELGSARHTDQEKIIKKMIQDGTLLTALERKEHQDPLSIDDEHSDPRLDGNKLGVIFPFVMLKNHQTTANDDAFVTAINLRKPMRHKRIESLNAASFSTEFNVFLTDGEGTSSSTVAQSSPKKLCSDTISGTSGTSSIPQLSMSPLQEEGDVRVAKDDVEKRPGNVLVVDKNETYADFHKKFVHICGINPDNIKVMTSAKRPILYHLIQAETGKEIPVLLKINDDVRLDMLYVHLFSLMDSYMQTHNLDMKFTIYSCFALSPSIGFIECILPSESQDDIYKKKELGTITDYFNAMICKYRSQVSPSVLSQALVKLPSLLSEISARLLADESLCLSSLISESILEGKLPPQSPYAFSEFSDKAIPSIAGKGSLPFGEESYQMVKKRTRPSHLSSTNVHIPDVSTSMDDLMGGIRSTKGTHKSTVSDEGVEKQQENSREHSRRVSTSDCSYGGSETIESDKVISVGATPSTQSRHTRGVPSNLSLQIGNRPLTQDIVQKWLVEQLTIKGIESLPQKVYTIIGSVIDKVYRPNGPLDCMNDITAEIQMSNFVKSTAAYSVATYLLRAGDRHGENLLIRPDGRMFHIDFGWCFGKDPKLMAPKMKVSKDLVKAMGGEGSADFESYINYVAEIFCMLRQDVYIIISLLYILQGGGMAYLDEAAQSHFYVIEDNYQLSLERDAAIYYILDVVKASMKAIMGQFIDAFHRFTQGFKR
ncbi:Phosphoinositide-3-kinase, class 3 [Giardia lamblia P15]|uniref:Phosphoinositide-3-kinase, class 3 n=1 Tax=Giardia intestinalis (strain P15) TaxID=658858 RepID=E1EVV4_GIAIA|nr:Phosphoinositide-3-kinase, class 3 [Giardia lamblia P15]